MRARAKRQDDQKQRDNDAFNTRHDFSTINPARHQKDVVGENTLRIALNDKILGPFSGIDSVLNFENLFIVGNGKKEDLPHPLNANDNKMLIFSFILIG